MKRIQVMGKWTEEAYKDKCFNPFNSNYFKPELILEVEK